MNRVFVYGTLKTGQRNAHLMRQAQFVGNFVTPKNYSMYVFDDYPAVCVGGLHAVVGEVYSVSEHQFSKLDELEAYPHFYQRIQIPTQYGDAWIYIVKAELCIGKQQISGVWPEIR